MKKYLIGFSPWKKFFKNYFEHCIFLKKNISLCSFIKKVNYNDIIYIWGYKICPKIFNYIRENNIRYIFVEDGLIRSFGLGSDFTKPYSLIFDSLSNYYDSRSKSDLEKILSTLKLNNITLIKSKKLIKYINHEQISKYNLNNNKLQNKLKIYLNQLRIKKKIIFIIGQVPSDDSIKYGTFKFKSELDLIKYNKKKMFL